MLKIKPISLKKANAFVEALHRHHGKAQGCKFCLSVYDNEKLVGVAIVGHPQGRNIDQETTVEVLRLCTDGTFNACSALYGRCARVAKEMGYEKIITYILESEQGASLRASGWKCEAEAVGGKEWTGQREKERHQYEQQSLFEGKKPPKELKKRYSRGLTNENHL